MYYNYSESFIRLAIRTVIAASVISGALSVRGQEALAGAPAIVISKSIRTAGHTVSVGAYHGAHSQWNSTFWDHASLETASFGFFGFNRVEPAGGPGTPGAIGLPDLWDGDQMHQFNLVGAYPNITGPSYDPFKTFYGGNGFAASMTGLVSRFDDVMRGGAGTPDTVWIGLTPDTDWKHGNDFEAGMTAQFVCGGKTRYPVTIRLPVYVAMSDEQYFMGPHYGYISAGINLRVPLRFISSRYGRWSAGTSADFCYYGTTTTEFVKSIGLQIPKVAAAFSVDL